MSIEASSDNQKPPQAVLISQSSLTSSENVLPIHNEQVGSIIENQLKAEIYNRARLVRFLSILDMVFLVVNLSVSIAYNDLFWVFFLFFPMCLSGYYGAKNYNKSLIIGYSSYLFIMTLLYVIIVLVYSSLIYLLLFFIELYFLYYTIKLSKYIGKANDDMLESLKDGWKPNPSLVVIHYY